MQSRCSASAHGSASSVSRSGSGPNGSLSSSSISATYCTLSGAGEPTPSTSSTMSLSHNASSDDGAQGRAEALIAGSPQQQTAQPCPSVACFALMLRIRTAVRHRTLTGRSWALECRRQDASATRAGRAWLHCWGPVRTLIQAVQQTSCHIDIHSSIMIPGIKQDHVSAGTIGQWHKACQAYEALHTVFNRWAKPAQIVPIAPPKAIASMAQPG